MTIRGTSALGAQPAMGANLECLLTCRTLRIAELPAVLAICQEYGFEFVETNPLVSFGTHFLESLQLSPASRLREFMAEAERRNARRCIANLCGTLIDTPTPFGVLFALDPCVAVISVPENVLWGFADDIDRADFQKLRVFAECCKEIAFELSAVFGLMGTESLHPEDVTLDAAAGHGAYRVDESFLSESHLRELFDWYVNVYNERKRQP